MNDEKYAANGKRLTLADRKQIQSLILAGKKSEYIGEKIGFTGEAVRKELRKNCDDGGNGYNAETAQRNYWDRLSERGKIKKSRYKKRITNGYNVEKESQ